MRIFILIASLVLLFSCTDKKQYLLYQGEVHGTFFHITYQSSEDLSLEIDSVFKVFNASLNNYDPNSLISKINNNEEVETDSLFRAMFYKAKEVYEKSDGAFDISVIDVIEVLTGTDRPRKYWSDLKIKLKKEGSELSEKIGQLKMVSLDGKMRLTDVADTEQIFRLIQSIPSPKAEPFKLWLAQLASERLDEIQDPEITIDRALEQYLNLGYSENWINQRLKSIEIRKELTDEWKKKRIERGSAICNFNRHHYKSVVG